MSASIISEDARFGSFNHRWRATCNTVISAVKLQVELESEYNTAKIETVGGVFSRRLVRENITVPEADARVQNFVLSAFVDGAILFFKEFHVERIESLHVPKVKVFLRLTEVFFFLGRNCLSREYFNGSNWEVHPLFLLHCIRYQS